MALTEKLELDLTNALRSVSKVDDALLQMTKRFKAQLAASLDPLSGIRIRDVDAREVTRELDRAVDAADTRPEITADARDVTTEIDRAIDSADTEPEITADADAVTVEIDQAVLDADTEAEVTGDASEVTEAIDQAVQDADLLAEVEGEASDVTSAIDDAIASSDATVDVEGDASAVAAAIDDAILGADSEVEVTGEASSLSEAIDTAISDVDATVTVDADTSAAVGALEDLSSSANEAAENAGILEGFTNKAGGAADLATGAFAGFAASLGDGQGKLELAAKGLGAVAAVGAVYFKSAIESDTATRRFTEGLSDFSAKVRAINLGGLNEDLSDLAIRTGNSDEAIFLAAGRLGELGKSAGATEAEVANLVQQVSVLAIRATTLNPTLGQAGDVADALSNAFARGGRALAPFGISLSSTEIQARALGDTGKTSAEQLTLFEKSAAGAALATERLGTRLGTDINEGAKGAEVRLRSLREQVGEIAEAFGAPIIEPTLRAFQGSLPIITEVGHGFGDLAKVLIPLLIEALDAVEPTIGSTGAVLRAIIPILDLIIGLVEALPDPVLAGVAAFILLNRSILALVTSLGPAVAGFAVLAPAIAAIGAITAVVTTVIGNNNKAKEEAARTSAALATELRSETKARQESIASLTEQAIQSKGLDSQLRALGLSYEQVTAAALAGKSGADLVRRALIDQGIAADGAGHVFRSLITEVDRLSDAFQDGAKRALEQAVNNKELSNESVAAAESQHLLNDGTTDYFTILEDLLPQQADLIKQHGDAAMAADRQETEERGLADAINKVIDATLELTNSELANTRARLALRESTARLTEAQQELAEKQKSGKATTAELEEAQRRLEGAELSQVESALRVVESQAKLADQQHVTGNAAVDAANHQANLRQAFLDLAGTLAPGSALRVRLEGLADKVAGFPPLNVNVNDADAQASLERYQRKIDALDGRVVETTVVIHSISDGEVLHAQSGGHFAPGQIGVVGEAGPELFVGGPRGTQVFSHEQSIALLSHLVGQQTNSLAGVLSQGRGGGGVSIGQMNVNEVAQDPRATAFALATELGRLADR